MEHLHPDVSSTKGSVTLELIIAFAIIAMTMSAAIIVIFGNQSVGIDTQTSNDALYKAQTMLEQTRAQSRVDFSSLAIGSHSSDEYSGPLKYTKTLTIAPDPADPSNPNKILVTSLVSWASGARNLNVTLSTLLTNPQGVVGSCNPTLSATEMNLWHNPQIISWDQAKGACDPVNDGTCKPELVKDLVAPYSLDWSSSNNFIISAITVVKSHLFVVGGAFQGSNKNTYLFVFSLGSDPTQQPTYRGYVNLTPTFFPSQVSDLPQDVTSDGKYAYVASSRDYCTFLSDCGQMIIVDVQNVDTTTLTPANANMYYHKVTGVTGSGNSAVGKSIFYNKGLIYLGLTKTSSGPEFNIIDVGNGIKSGTPALPQFAGSYNVGSTTRAITVANGFAYLATGDKTHGNAFMVLDVSNPLTPSPKWNNIITGSTFGLANAVTSLNKSLFVGYTYNGAAPSELYVLNNPDPATQKPSLTSTSLNIPTSNVGVQSMIVKGQLAFVVTGTDTNLPGDFEVWNVGDPAGSSFTSWATPISYDGGGSGTAGGCKGSSIYVGSRPTSADKSHISVFYPGKQSQTITFSAIPTKTYGDADFDPGASASSGLPITYTSLTGTVCTVVSTSVHIVTTGTCTIRASQAGNYAYTAASNVNQSFSVAKANTITAIACPVSTTYSGSAQTPCTASVTGPGLSQSVAPTYSNNTNVGTATANASYAGSADYNPSSDSKTFTIDKAPSVTTVTCPASVAYNGSAQTPCTTTVTGAGGLSLTPSAAYSNNVNVGSATAGYVYAGDTNHTGSSDSKTFTINKATPVITWNNPTGITYGTPLGVAQLNASSGGVAGSFTYTPSSGTVLNAGVGQTLSVHFVPTDTANYNTPSPDKTVTITVNKATPSFSVTLQPSSSVTAGTVVHDEMQLSKSGSGAMPSVSVIFTLFKNGTCGGGTLQTSSGPVDVTGLAVSANRITISSDKPKISYQAHYIGDANYVSVTGVCQALTVI